MASKNLPIMDWLEIESSAPGKLIISGEYSVMYEKQAVATAIDLRTRVRIRANKDGKVRLILKNLGNTREWPTSSLTTCRLISKYSECLEYNDTMPTKLNHLLTHRYYGDHDLASASTSSSGQGSSCPHKQKKERPKSIEGNKKLTKQADDAALAFLLLYIGLGDSYCSSARPPINVEVESDVPVGSGLGSSSAYSVSLCGALMRVFRVAAEKYIISNWAFNVDKFFHGKPSGVDNNIVTHGGYILFHNGKMKSVETTHRNHIKVMLIDTGVSRSTRALCEKVNAKLREDPVDINHIFHGINEMTSQIWRRINQPDFEPVAIYEFIRANQDYLDALGVGHEKLTEIIETTRPFGMETKQTGAGGGGTAFLLYDANVCNIELVRGEVVKLGVKAHLHSIGCPGLIVKLVLDPAKKFPGDR